MTATDYLPPPREPGASLTDSGCYFSLHSATAEAIWVCLFDGQGRETRVALDHWADGLWYTFIAGIGAGQQYGFRVRQPGDVVGNENKLLLDPYGRALSGSVQWHESLLWHNHHTATDSAPYLPRSVVAESASSGAPPVLETMVQPAQRIIYECHVKGLTVQHPEIPETLRGTYLGLSHPVMLDYYRKLGITTLQIMPCFSFMDEARLVQMGLRNYWGYNPVSFFVPEWRYAAEDPVAEFRKMVSELHAAGLEVILDVVFNHTAEGALEAGMFCYKGIDPDYYRWNQGYTGGRHWRQWFDDREKGATDVPAPMCNDSGCGNSFNTGSGIGLTLAMAALRYWVSEFGVDGFRFDLAASLMRENGHLKTGSSILRAIMQDPLLRQRTLIAEPWDIGHGGYQLGQFPASWLEVNDHFRDGVRSFWRGDPGGVAELCTRLMGSRDIFDRTQRGSHCSVNHVTYHDGFTLHDLVSYRRRHNQANGEEGRDGHGHNLSCNHGVEGATEDAGILRKRARHQRNLLTILMLSRGTPHLLSGDEFGHTQQGNNNAYCQDNEVSWLRWKEGQQDGELLAFVRKLIALRQQGLSLAHARLADEKQCGIALAEQANVSESSLCSADCLQWFADDGALMGDARWHDPETRFLGLYWAPGAESDSTGKSAWLILLNGESKTQRIALSSLSLTETQEGRWHQVLATDMSAPEGCVSGGEKGSTETDYLTLAADTISIWRRSGN